MLFWTIFIVAMRALWTHKLRSILAMLGIIIGVGAVIAMLGLGTGAQKQMMNRLSAMGTNLLMVRPGQRGQGGVMGGNFQTLTLDDARALLTGVPDILDIAPGVRGSAQVKFSNRNTRASIIGTAHTYFPIRNFEIERGRTFTEAETDRMARVVVVGSETAKELFDTDDPVDQMVKVNGINFRIVGLLKSKGDQGFFNPDKMAIMPYTTAMKQLLGLDYLQEIDIQSKDGADLTKVQDDVTALLHKRHRLQPEAPDDFNIQNQAEMVDTANTFALTLKLLLGGIGSISLLVGGIGIMNIMLVTVTERTREIGIRKAIGAKDRDILGQFLLEAMLMSGVGGLIGVTAGLGGAALLGRFMPFPSIVTLSSVLISLSFSAAVGIFFGFYPAWRASSLDPIDALRYE
jgi:putative ABC transport system permease protein